MQRCLELARLGAGHVAPNPMVGAVLVYEGRIIGEGYHQEYGKAHAEVNCLAAVKEEDIPLIPLATLYVSLEPCAHFGKTPPCADLIISKKIPRVVVGCRDPFPEVDGKGIEKLRAAGVEVKLGVLEKECIELNKRFFTFHTRHRPYILLKWAQSADLKIGGSSLAKEGSGGSGISPGGTAGSYGGSAAGTRRKENDPTGHEMSDDPKGAEMGSAMAPKMASDPMGQQRGNDPAGRVAGSRVLISNEYSNRLVHKWRSEEVAILVGTNTALLDDPSLTVRLWNGPNPIRLVLDKELRLPDWLHVFDRQVRTVVFNMVKMEEGENLSYYRLDKAGSLVNQLVNACYALRIQSVLVEGGAGLLQSFIDEGCWDEARVITNNKLEIPGGLAAPVLKNASAPYMETLLSDTIRYYGNDSIR